MQHYLQKISENDLEQIRHIPHGGNWQNIPLHIKSKRLEQIREMTKERGIVRTSYYGRLRLDQPSYTISTYYNRPGNGTNIHPNEDRVITHREAARLQSFPDKYKFYGGETDIRIQIGNSVPPLLAYSLGRHLLQESKSSEIKFVDLFSGCGGLSYGLARSGLRHKLSVDHKKHYLNTLKENFQNILNHEIETKCLDLSKKKDIELTINLIKDANCDLIAGGPPCQGFSTAGFRQPTDTRNSLTNSFLKIISETLPPFFMMENVEGILSYEKGNFIKNLIRTFNELGYDTGDSPIKLNSEQFGVPQMRRRVFIIGSRYSSHINSPPIKFAKCLGRRENKDQKQIFVNAYPVCVGEAFYGLKNLLEKSNNLSLDINKENKLYSELMKGSINEKEFLEGRDHFFEYPELIN